MCSGFSIEIMAKHATAALANGNMIAAEAMLETHALNSEVAIRNPATIRDGECPTCLNTNAIKR